MSLKARVFAVFLSLTVVCAMGQDLPGKAEDAEAERQKILRASDQVEVLTNSLEALRKEMDSLRNDVGALRAENSNLNLEVTKLKNDSAALRTALEKSESNRQSEKKVLLEEIDRMVSEGRKSTKRTDETVKKPDVTPVAKDNATDTTPEKGFYHTVEHGQTLWTIVQAYRDAGVKVTVDDVRKANSLGTKAAIHTGQKLFIPKK